MPKGFLSKLELGGRAVGELLDEDRVGVAMVIGLEEARPAVSRA